LLGDAQEEMVFKSFIYISIYFHAPRQNKNSVVSR